MKCSTIPWWNAGFPWLAVIPVLHSILFPGNHYGTPKPSEVVSVPGRAVDAVIPGAHPSSEGKRRRNRSNVEAMAAKHNNPEEDQENQRELSTNGEWKYFKVWFVVVVLTRPTMVTYIQFSEFCIADTPNLQTTVSTWIMNGIETRLLTRLLWPF